jgi:protein phosphatase
MELLIASFKSAHEDIQRQIEEAQDGRLFDMGCTVVAALLGPRNVVYQYAGDSRLYWFRDGRVLHASMDHSVVQVLINLGQLKAEDSEKHPMSGRLTSSLGGNGKWERVQVSPAFHEGAVFTPLPGDVILLCSDGVNTEMNDESIGQIACSDGNAEQRLQAFKEVLLSGLARDNFTITLAIVKSGSLIAE